MSDIEQRSARVDAHLEDLFGGDPATEAVRTRSVDAGLPDIAVSPAHGRLLRVLALARGARRILEIGTLGGYSAVWLARALPPDGRLVTLEADPEHAATARRNLDEAGVGGRVDVRVGRGLDLLDSMRAEGEAPFDLVFIDADKEPYARYLDAAMALSAPGTLIVADNVVRDGRIADGPSDDPSVAGTQRFNAALASHPRLTGAIVQLIGVKGHDGMAFAIVADD